MQRTPPNTYSSDSNIPSSVDYENESYVNYRKRKQPDSNDMEILEEKLNNQLLLWDSKITNSITLAVSSAITQEMTKVSSILSEINVNMSQLNKDNQDIRKCLDETNNRLCEMEKHLNDSSARQDSLESRVTTLEGNLSRNDELSNQVENIENKISIMEQQARSCNIEISNMPERRGENLLKILEFLGEAIKYPIRATDIISVHRVQQADPKSHRQKNVIVKFVNKIIRDNVISACRASKGLDSSQLHITGSPVTIYVNEHLTLKNKLLFRQCREQAKKQNYKYVWIKHGTILVRKTDTSPAVAIRTVHEVAKIK